MFRCMSFTLSTSIGISNPATRTGLNSLWFNSPLRLAKVSGAVLRHAPRTRQFWVMLRTTHLNRIQTEGSRPRLKTLRRLTQGVNTLGLRVPILVNPHRRNEFIPRKLPANLAEHLLIILRGVGQGQRLPIPDSLDIPDQLLGSILLAYLKAHARRRHSATGSHRVREAWGKLPIMLPAHHRSRDVEARPSIIPVVHLPAPHPQLVSPCRDAGAKVVLSIIVEPLQRANHSPLLQSYSTGQATLHSPPACLPPSPTIHVPSDSSRRNPHSSPDS